MLCFLTSALLDGTQIVTAVEVEMTELVETMANTILSIMKYMLPIIIISRAFDVVRHIFFDDIPAEIKIEKEMIRAKNGVFKDGDNTSQAKETVTIGNCVKIVSSLQNKVLPGVFKSKLSKIKGYLETACLKVQSSPDQSKYLQKTVNYYIPTLVNITNTYSEFCKISSRSSEIEQSMREIEETVDMMVEAFQSLLHKVYQEDALNASTDAQVLRSVLIGDGLVDEMELATEKRMQTNEKFSYFNPQNYEAYNNLARCAEEYASTEQGFSNVKSGRRQKGTVTTKV